MPGSGRRAVRAAVLSTPEGYDIDVDQDREVGGDDLQQMLETQRLQHRQRRLVHAALAGEVAAAQCDQVPVLVLHPLQVVAQAFEHEMLKIEYAVAVAAARRAQQTAAPPDAFRGNPGARADRRRRRRRGCRSAGPAPARRRRAVLAGLAGDRPTLAPNRRARGTAVQKSRERQQTGSCRKPPKPTHVTGASRRLHAGAEERLPRDLCRASVADARAPCQFRGCRFDLAIATTRPGLPPGARPRTRVRVLLPLPLPAALDYRAPEDRAPPEPGSFVRVPLGGRSLIGVVWDGDGEPAELAPDRLKRLPRSCRCRRWNRRCADSSSASPPTRWRPRVRCCAWR